jgi:hypothetical protein
MQPREASRTTKTYRQPDESANQGHSAIPLQPYAVALAATAEIKEWLKQHGSGWKPSLVSYAPVQLIEGDGYTLNFHRDHCIANVRAADGTWRQLVKDLKPSQSSPNVFQR